MEGLRWLHYLKEDGMLIVNDQAIKPMPVVTGAAEYPDNILNRLNDAVSKVFVINALEMAKELGNIRVSNTVLLGVLAQNMDIEKQLWKDTLSGIVPKKTIEINLEAFERGYNIRV